MIDTPFNGLGPHLGNLARLSAAQTRSISPENFTGEKGAGGAATDGTGARAARELGQGWKLSPSVRIPVAHVHGGELSFGSLDDAFRHSITKLSHLAWLTFF